MPRQRENDENNVLRSLRALRGFTQSDAAKRAGVSRALWSAWEGRLRPLSVAHLNLIQTVLGLSTKQIESLRQWWGQSCFEGTPFEKGDLTKRTLSALEKADITTIEQFEAESREAMIEKIGERAHAEVTTWVGRKTPLPAVRAKATPSKAPAVKAATAKPDVAKKSVKAKGTPAKAPAKKAKVGKKSKVA